MAIKLIPQEKTFRESRWLTLFLILSIVLFLVVFSAYFFIGYLIDVSGQNVEYNRKVISARRAGERELEDKVFGYEQKIADFPLLLEKQKNISEFFENLQKVVHPQIWFSELEFNVPGEVVILRGEAESFQVLSQQEELFRQNPFFSEIDLHNASPTEEGKIEFNLSLFLNL